MQTERFAKVQAPATTANLGPGFDSLGIALALHNTVELQPASGPRVEVTGQGAGELPTDETNLCYCAAQRLAEEAGYSGHWHLCQQNSIPLARGLGSSSAAIVAGIIAASQALDYPLDRQEALRLAVEMEGHPDNVAPALFGGLTVCFEQHDGTKAAVALDAPEGLVAVLAIPDFQVNTQHARDVLPDQVPMCNAVFNTGQAAAVVAMLASGQYDGLADAMRDRLHQPYRAHLVPGMDELIQAAIEAGARGAALSGSGPTIVALAEHDNSQRVQAAMLQAGPRTGKNWTGMILSLDSHGVKILT